MKNAITVDVEDYFHVSAFSDSIDRGDWDRFECRVEGNTHALLKLFREKQVKATFFVLGWVAERFPQLVKDIDSEGHEVACHGMTHKLVYEQDREEFYQETIRAKGLLEDLIQKPVHGYRAASYSITRKSLWSLDVLLDAGFTYDSSIFPVHHDRYGIPGSTREPHRLKAPSGRSLTEFPLSTVKLLGYTLPVSGGGYFRLFPYSFSRWALRSINNKERRPFIFYLHPWEIDTGQPRIKAGRLSTFRHYNNIDRCQGRLKRLLADFDLVTAREVLRDAKLLPA